MAASNSESSDLSDNVSVSDSNESIQALFRALRLTCRDLERAFVNELTDCVERPNVWTTAYFNERAVDLNKKKEEFFAMVLILIERCESFESDQYADVIDNCELFRSKIIALWNDFLQLSCIEASLSDFEKHDVEQEAPEIVETVGVFESDILAIGCEV